MTGGRDSNSIPDGLARERRERFSPPLFLFAWWHLFLILLSPANSIYLGQSSPCIIVGFGKGAADPPNLLITPGPPCSLTQQNRAQKELFLFTAQLGKLFHPASPPGIPGAWRLQFCPGAAVPRQCPDFPVQLQNTAGLRFIPLALLPFLVFQQLLVLGQSRSRERPSSVLYMVCLYVCPAPK